MGEQLVKASRKWHIDQEKLFLDLLCLPEFKPIGGNGDGVMERKMYTRWAPLLERFNQDNAALCEGRQTTTKMGFKSDFDEGMLKRKWDTFKSTYAR
jgi:hypothetical protein